MDCRHCHRATVNRPRGLCWSCYYTDAIRDCYPSKNKAGRRDADFSGPTPQPESTPHLPGTVGKESALADRVTAKQSLFHPGDARRDLK